MLRLLPVAYKSIINILSELETTSVTFIVDNKWRSTIAGNTGIYFYIINNSCRGIYKDKYCITVLNCFSFPAKTDSSYKKQYKS